tara:strand:+ start:8806 stop:8919 length:114 start_codon:yes stop_codon:yes gene_type:complete
MARREKNYESKKIRKNQLNHSCRFDYRYYEFLIVNMG